MEIKKFDNSTEASKYSAEIIINEIKKNSKTILGLATGSTPKQMYEFMIESYKNGKVSFKDCKSFNLDEYSGLSKEMENQSYRYFMNENLFNHIDINKEETNFPINFENEYELDKEFNEYDEKINSVGGIDIQVLGIGENGHIAFNEPGSKINSITRCIGLTESTINANKRFFNSVDEVPKKAVTMGLGTILKSKKIILLAFGEKKREAITKLINAKSFDENWPCTCLWDHPNLIIVTDIKK